jgi:hypothetical protein
MAGLDPATQCAHVCARGRLSAAEIFSALSRGLLGGRVKPGHVEDFEFGNS